MLGRLKKKLKASSFRKEKQISKYILICLPAHRRCCGLARLETVPSPGDHGYDESLGE